MTLSRDQLLGFNDDRIGRVDVPELGGEVCVATLTVAETDKISNLDPKASANVELMILGACDEDGKRLFTEKDRDSLRKLPNDVVKTIAKAVMAHNGYNAGEEAKNASSETASDDSASVSP